MSEATVASAAVIGCIRRLRLARAQAGESANPRRGVEGLGFASRSLLPPPAELGCSRVRPLIMGPNRKHPTWTWGRDGEGGDEFRRVSDPLPASLRDADLPHKGGGVSSNQEVLRTICRPPCLDKNRIACAFPRACAALG